MEKHSPLPWRIQKPLNNGQPRVGTEAEGYFTTAYCSGATHDEAEANAAFIVRAVNCHAELIDALKTAKVVIKELFKEMGQKEIGDWAIINEGCIQVDKTLTKASEPIR